MDKARVAIIGCGAFARSQHLPNCARNERVELTWACSRSEGNRRYAEENYQPHHTTPDARDVFDADDVDIVILSVPHGLHEEMVLAAAASGKHVLCEKPMAMSNEESWHIVRAVEKAGVKLCVNYNRRFAPAMRDLKTAYRAHRADPQETPWRFYDPSKSTVLPEEDATMLLIRIQDESSSYRMVHMDPASGGGQIIGETCHWLDLACWLMEADPVRVSAVGSTRLNHIITVEFPGGSYACIFFGVGGTFDYPKELYEIQDHGALFTSQCFVENQHFGFVDPVRKTFPFQHDDFGDAGSEGGLPGYVAKLRARSEKYAASGKKSYGNLFPDKGHEGLLDAFVTAVLQDKPSPVDQRAGLRATYLCVRAIESIRSGHPVPVNVESLHPHILT